MAEQDSTLGRFVVFERQQLHGSELIAPGVKRNVCGWGCLFEGKRDALIAAGLAKPGWFSDGTARTKGGKVKRQLVFEFEGRRIKTVTDKKGYCGIYVDYTVEEQEVADKISDELMDQNRAEQSRAFLIAEAAGEGGAQRVAKERLFEGACGILYAFNAVNSPTIPWTCEQHVIERAKALIAELKDLIEENPVRPNRILRAKADQGFQAFIGKLVS